MPHSTLRTQRIEARLLPHQKLRIERAASLRGLSVSDFVVQIAVEAAARTISEHETLELTQRDQIAFVRALVSPPAPNPRLRREMKRYLENKRA
jgi:uncharacterized protein (DUF1778 family)